MTPKGQTGLVADAIDEFGLRIVLSIYFAQRELARRADVVLADRGFGRAEHRALTLVGIQPGIAVGELARLLNVTNQSLNRVLRPLVQGGFVTQHSDPGDLRQKKLYLTAEGKQIDRLAYRQQRTRIVNALSETDASTAERFLEFCRHLMDDGDRDSLDELCSRQPKHRR